VPPYLFTDKTKRKDMAEGNKIEQPELQLQMLLDNVLSEEPTDVMFRGKRHTVGWLKKGSMRKFSHICMKEENADKRNVKVCVVLLLNNIWKIRLLYWIWWRWLYYVCDLDDVEVLRVVDVAKKKIPSAASSLLTILATGMTDLMMTMTRKEASATQAGQVGVPPTP
jgi:hypothetical protein